MSKRTKLIVVSVVFCALVTAVLCENFSDDRSPQEAALIKQGATMDVINGLDLGVRSYIIEYGNPPTTLQNLFASEKVFRPGVEQKYSYDGWGHPIHYYTNGDTYALLSFGRDGVPQGQQEAEKIDRNEEGIADLDLVLIGGVWAQAVPGFDR